MPFFGFLVNHGKRAERNFGLREKNPVFLCFSFACKAGGW